MFSVVYSGSAPGTSGSGAGLPSMMMRLLRSRADQYPLLLELREKEDEPRPLDGLRRIFDKLESL